MTGANVAKLRASDYARITLAAIRILNGGTALAAPRAFTRQIGTEADAGGPTVYVLRMFGIRTVLIGLELLSRDPAVRQHAARVAVVVHASDAASAAAAGLTRQLPSRSAAIATTVSTINLALAAVASKDARRGSR